VVVAYFSSRFCCTKTNVFTYLGFKISYKDEINITQKIICEFWTIFETKFGSLSWKCIIFYLFICFCTAVWNLDIEARGSEKIKDSSDEVRDMHSRIQFFKL